MRTSENRCPSAAMLIPCRPRLRPLFRARDIGSLCSTWLATQQRSEPTIFASLIRLQPERNVVAGLEHMALEQDQRISEVVKREQSRLRNFIRGRLPDPSDVEDIVQDVFYKLVEANRLLMPIEHVTGWLFRVARNRITDL